jgi:acylphosphatase
MDNKHLKITITGNVQGVGFRYGARRQAELMGLQGLGRNRTDGSVHIEVEGPVDKLEQFLGWCYNGPPAADVETIEAELSDTVGMTDFAIL